jgi:hypothetical protein
MKQFFKNIQTRFKDFWIDLRPELGGFIIIGGCGVFGLYTGIMKSENFIFIGAVFIIYKVFNFIWSTLKKRGIDKIIYKVIGVLQNIAVLFFLLFLLDFFGWWFFKHYLGYNYFSWVDHYIFK